MEEEKMGLLERYKYKRIDKLERKLESTKEESPSSVFVHSFFNVLLDIITWAIIAWFVYTWWNTRAQPITCDRINMDFCNACFGAVRSTANGLFGNISGIINNSALVHIGDGFVG